MNWKLAIGVSAISVLALGLEQAFNVPPVWRSGSAAAVPLAPGRLIAAAGLVEPASETRQLEATTVGQLVTMNVVEGDHVTAGQGIAEIENADLKAQLAEAEATLAVKDE